MHKRPRLLLWALLSFTTIVTLSSGKDQVADPVRLGQPVNTTVVPPQHRTSIAFSPDGKKLAWMHYQPDRAPNEGGGLMIHLWDLDKRIPLSEMKPINEFTYACSPLRFTPNGRMLLAGCFQLTTEYEELAKPGTLVGNSVRVWLAASGRELPILQRENGRLEFAWDAVAVSADGKTMMAASSKKCRTWKLPGGEVVRSFDLESPKRLVFSGDGKYLAGTLGASEVRVWATQDGKETIKLAEGGQVLGLSQDGKHLATLQDEKVCLWEVEGGRKAWAVPGKLGKDEEHGSRFDFSPDGKRLAWNEDGKISVADASNGKVVMTITGQPGPLGFSPEGKRLALACPDGTALVWDLGGR